MVDELTGEFTDEEKKQYPELCTMVDDTLRGVSVDLALMVLVAVTARLCSEVDNEAECCLTVCEDLLAEFRHRMETRPAEVLIPILSPNDEN